jgi:hypothetical protein
LQEQDTEFQHFLKLQKRDRDWRMTNASKRITSAPSGVEESVQLSVTVTVNVDDQDWTTAQIDPNLKLRVD